MTSNQAKLRIGIGVIPALIFCISCTQDALVYQYQKLETLSSTMAFLMGATAILGGGTFEWIIWLANPIAVISYFKFLKETRLRDRKDPTLNTQLPSSKYSSQWLSLYSTVLAFSFCFWTKILASESGATGEIFSFQLGYWLWVSSITILSVGINVYSFWFRTGSGMLN